MMWNSCLSMLLAVGATYVRTFTPLENDIWFEN